MRHGAMFWLRSVGMARMVSSLSFSPPVSTGVEALGVPNERFLNAAAAVARGVPFPPLILAGERPDTLVCLEGNLRLTGHALADFPVEVECLVGTAPKMGDWAQ
jgi:hypothetical protein